MMLYAGFTIVMNTESPVVVVLSGSMEPALQRGDLLLLSNPPAEKYKTGDIVVYRVPGAQIPIVHRVIEARERRGSDDNDSEMEVGHPDADLPYQTRKHFSRTGSRTTMRKAVSDQLLLTKGDDNPTDDIVLYNGLDRLRRRHIIGKVRGYISIILNDIRTRPIYAFLRTTLDPTGN